MKKIFTAYKIGKKSSVQGLNFCPPTGTSPNWHFFELFVVPLRI